MPPSLAHQIGRVLIAGFAGTTVPADLRALAREFGLGGVILFARNIEAPEQVEELTRELRTLDRDLPLWVSVDQEGGRVARLKAPFTEWPPMMALGRSKDDSLATRFGRALAAEIRAVGVTLDFAPVLDVLTNADNPVIGDRALSEAPPRVGALGRLIVEALQAAGVAACGKHFPGHGDTSVDSHLDLPIIEHPPDRIRRVELVPFKAAIEAGVAAIMTAHVLVPSFDEDRPATLSPRIIRGLLRDELGYQGMILSDDLEMKAIAGRYAVGEAAVSAIGAGCDGLLICGADQAPQTQALEALIHAVEDEALSRARVDDALSRIRRQKERFLLDPSTRRDTRRAAMDLIGCDAHRRIADEMRQYV